MKERIIRLSELMEYHEIKEIFREKVACFQMNSRLVNIDTIPPAFADMYSFMMVREGTAVFTLNYHEYVVSKGDMLLFYPNLLVSLVSQSADFQAMHLLCERKFFENLLLRYNVFQSYLFFFCSAECPIFHLSPEQSDVFFLNLKQISRNIIYPSIYQEDILVNLLYVSMFQVLELINASLSSSEPRTSHCEILFHKFIGLLTLHYKKEHQIDFYARELSVSNSYLSRIVNKITHKSVGYFVTGLLYAEACRLLAYTDMTIQEISDELSYSDQSAFGKFFKSNSGMSPLQYRNMSVKRESSMSGKSGCQTDYFL